MSDGTKIEWTDATANAINGCTVVSPGCANCYAMKQAHRFPVRQGLTRQSPSGMTWTGEVRLNEKVFDQVLRWTKPRRIFWNAHGDTFHKDVPDEWIDQMFAVMALTPQHTHQVLTKRPERMRDYVTAQARGGRYVSTWIDRWEQEGRIKPFGVRTFIGSILTPKPLPNVWLGVSVEDQQRANERIPILLDTPAAVRWLSMEPLLGPVDLTHLRPPSCTWLDALTGDMHAGPAVFREYDRGVDWVVVGGESGPGARPMHPDWARDVRDHCADAGVPFHFKQWGDWEPSLDRDRDDPDWRADYTNDYGDRGKSRWLNLAGGCGFHGDRFHVMRRVGKRAAGRFLDGAPHDGIPA